MINLPQTTRNRAYFSIAYMLPGRAWDDQFWSVLPVPEILNRDISGNTRVDGTVAQGGYTVETITRACLPDEDMASFSVDFGFINGVYVDPLDLSGYFVRIDVVNNETFPESGSGTSFPSAGFKTVFVGYVYNAKVSINPSASNSKASGKKTYYCQGILSRTRDWPMTYHAAFGGASGTTLQKCYGNPGYNVPINGLFRETIGNKSSSTDYVQWGTDPTQGFTGHALPIDRTTTEKWTDYDTIKHALSSSRQDGEPIFTLDFSGAAGLFIGIFAWPVNVGDSCFDHLRRVCNRSRGRGSVYADWTSDGTRTGTISLFLKARPSFAGTVSYFTKAQFSSLELTEINTIPGQTSGSETEIDLVGDHRFFGAFEYEDRASAVYDYLELVGERIQMVANLGLFGGAHASLQKGWTTDDENEFNSVTNLQQRLVPRFNHVYRRFTLKNGWDFKGYVDTLTPATDYLLTNMDILCGDDGTVRERPYLPDDLSNSPIMTRIMSDVPLYEGKDYSGIEEPGFWSTWTTDYMPPGRCRPQLLMFANEYSGQPASEKRWVPLEMFGWNLQVDDFGVLICQQGEESTGQRSFARGATYGFTPSEVASLVPSGVGLDPERLMLILGLELSNHVRMCGNIGPLNTGTADERGRRLVIPVNGIHFWCGPGNAAWQLNPFNQSSGKLCEALRLDGSTPIRIIRDDRERLSFMYALAEKYYGEVHNPGTWSLRDCGLKTSFANGGSTSLFPTLGRLVSTVAVSPSQKITLNTPITSVHYDHNEGVTTWRTDYVNYQPGIQ